MTVESRLEMHISQVLKVPAWLFPEHFEVIHTPRNNKITVRLFDSRGNAYSGEGYGIGMAARRAAQKRTRQLSAVTNHVDTAPDSR